MPSVLTAAARITCAHQGTVQPRTSQTKLTVDGQSVLVDGDLDGAPISGCLTPTTSSSKPCTMVASLLSGRAIKLTVGGKAALLETAAGLTDGLPAPANLWNVQSAGQTKLSAL